MSEMFPGRWSKGRYQDVFSWGCWDADKIAQVLQLQINDHVEEMNVYFEN